MTLAAIDFIVFVFALVPVPATVANIYLWHQYFRSGQPRSWLLRTLAIGATVVNLASAYFGFLAVRRVLGVDPLDWTPTVSALAALSLEIVPIYFALEFHRRDRGARRRASDQRKRPTAE